MLHPVGFSFFSSLHAGCLHVSCVRVCSRFHRTNGMFFQFLLPGCCLKQRKLPRFLRSFCSPFTVSSPDEREWKRNVKTRKDSWQSASQEGPRSKIFCQRPEIREIWKILKVLKIKSLSFLDKFQFSKRLILRFKMGHSERQNGSFWKAKWAVLRCKTAHFEKERHRNYEESPFFLLSDLIFVSKTTSSEVLNSGIFSWQNPT